MCRLTNSNVALVRDAINIVVRKHDRGKAENSKTRKKILNWRSRIILILMRLIWGSPRSCCLLKSLILALSHLQKAISLNCENEVSWYRLWKVERILGNTAEPQKAIAEFQRLHLKKTNRPESGKKLFSPDEITKQDIDPNAPNE